MLDHRNRPIRGEIGFKPNIITLRDVKYEVKSVIGKTAVSTVYLVRKVQNNLLYAIRHVRIPEFMSWEPKEKIKEKYQADFDDYSKFVRNYPHPSFLMDC